MCANGVNTEQFLQMIDQINDHIALEYRWVHRLAHTAGDGSAEKTSAKLHEAQAMLADVRALLDEAKDTYESEAFSAANQTTVHLV